MNAPTGRTAAVVRAAEAKTLVEGPLGAYMLADPESTGGGLAVLVHTLAPRALGSPVHTHRHEDEWSFVLEGAVGVELDGSVSIAEPGDLVLKPRGVPHAFWNAGDAPARFLEIITPGGFERYFSALAELFAAGGPPDLEALGLVAEQFGLDVDPGSVPRLAQTHQLAMGG